MLLLLLLLVHSYLLAHLLDNVLKNKNNKARKTLLPDPYTHLAKIADSTVTHHTDRLFVFRGVPQGNVLEPLNFQTSLFEKHFLKSEGNLLCVSEFTEGENTSITKFRP